MLTMAQSQAIAAFKVDDLICKFFTWLRKARREEKSVLETIVNYGYDNLF